MKFYEQLFEEKDPVKSSPLPLDEDNSSADKGKKENSCLLAGDQTCP